MRDILRLVRRDLRHATSHVMAVIVLFGLVVIPSLFTWFNVIASWDPFSNVKNLKVAVASTDDGYQSDLVPIRINVGEQVLSALRANDDLDWVITTEEDAIDGTRSGAYYAAIVLPPSFSADMLTFYADGAQRTHIAYYTNEKKNALAPKITGQGAEGLSAQISETFTRTLSDIALSLLSSLSDYLADGDTQATLARMEARVGALATQLRAGAHTADMFTALIGSSIPLADSASNLITASGSALNDAAGAVGDGSAAIDSLKSELSAASKALSDAIGSTNDAYDAVADAIDELFTQVDGLTGAQVQVIETLATAVQQQIDRYTALRDTLETEIGPSIPASAQQDLAAVIDLLDDAIARQQNVHDLLTQAADDIASGGAAAQASRQQILDAIDDAQAALAAAQDTYDSQLKPQLDQLAATLETIGDDMATVKSDLAGLAGASGGVSTALTRAQGVTSHIATSLGEAADTFDRVQGALVKAADTGDFDELSALIGADPSVLAAALAEPVRVDRTPVYPVVSFGAGMAPLYTVLSLWVGALLMTVAIRVDVNRRTLDTSAELSPTQKYLGRYGIFALLGLAQSTLVTVGLNLFVQIDPVHPFLFILAGWVASLVFTLIIYTAVVAFGNAGKALSVLLLVVQISGSGGAYPLQLLPQWFQSVSPFLPATHAINAMRAAIAGTYGADYWVSLGLLAAFILPALLLGLVLRRPLISFNRGLAEALESTKLM